MVTPTPYDSTKDTLSHIRNVQDKILVFVHELIQCAFKHDMSKFDEPEKSVYDVYTPQLSSLEYGSNAYKVTLQKMKVGIDHHYSVSPHHPEYYVDGINGMNLINIVEMLSDWKAAGERTKTGDLRKSIEINSERFHIDDQLKQILLNTACYLGWI